MPTLSTVLLSIKGEVRKANLQLNSGGDLVMDTIQKYFKKKDEPECICYYEYDNKVIFIFGYKKGKKVTAKTRNRMLDGVSINHKHLKRVGFVVVTYLELKIIRHDNLNVKLKHHIVHYI